MEDTEELYIATLEGQFASFAKMLNWSCSRDTITLYCSDYWMRQSDIIDDRRVTMTDTGIIWNTFSKAELNWDEWHEYVSELCVAKELNKLEVEVELTNCGLPGATRVYVPQYRDFFDTYKSKKALVICESLDSCGKPKKKMFPFLYCYIIIFVSLPCDSLKLNLMADKYVNAYVICKLINK